MKRFALLLLATAAVACGDNSDECGPGTTAVDGLCTPDGSGAICGNGTTLDTTTGACAVDPNSCGGGTVLVNGTCQDPTAGLAIDLEEAAEPNGLDAGSHSAGTIALKPVDDPKGFVVHGCVKPVTDAADLDAYTISVTAPTLVDITADGVQGLAAGFVSLSNPNDSSLASWQRFGLNLANDMSHREIYFPKAGTYVFVMSDTRSLLGLVDGASDYLQPAGNPDGTSCYYVTLKQKAIPAPTTLPVPGGISGPLDGKVHFYSAALPNGYIDLVETVDSAHAAAAAVLNVSDAFRAIDSTGELFFSGIKATDTSVIVADFVYDYGITPANYTLTFNSASSAQALPTDGSVLSSTIAGKAFTFPDFSTVNEFYFDATQGQLLGMNVAFSKTMQGVIADEAGVFYGTFGGLGTTVATFTTYKGLWRAPHAGRFYFIVFDPTAGATHTVGTAFTVTSTLTSLTPGTAVVGTPLTAQTNNAFNSNPYNVDITNNIWDSFNATGTNTGTLTVSVFDPAAAFGRLDPVTLSTGASAGATKLASFTIPQAGGLQGYITKTLGVNNVLVTVHPNTPTGVATFGLDIEPRVFTNLMDIVAPHTTTNNGDTVAAGDTHRYYFTTTPGNKVTITVHPTVATNDPVAATLAANETVVNGGNITGAGADEVIDYVQNASGFTALAVSNVLPVAMTYNLTIVVTPPYYTKHASATAFSDACTGGTAITLTSTDDGVSDPQTTPAGFTFYGATLAQYVIGSNGYLTFDLVNDTGATYPHPIPDGTGLANIMPLWEDLVNVVVCKKVAGTKTTIQWTGVEYSFFGGGLPAQFQAILDTADGSIEYVYGPNNQSDGTNSGAIGGVQDPAGAQATETGDGNVTAFGAPNSSVKLTHP